MNFLPPPLFTERHIEILIKIAAKKPAPCILVGYDEELHAAAILSISPWGIHHWCFAGPASAKDVAVMVAPFNPGEYPVHFVAFEQTPGTGQTKH